MTPDDLDKIEARANAAKEHKFESECDGTFECPLCGEGILDGRLYDAWVEHGPEDVLAILAEVRMLRYLLGKK